MPGPNAILDDCDYGLTTAQVEAVKDVLIHRENLKRMEALALQKQAAAKAGERIIKRFDNGVGGFVDLSIMPYLYHKLGQFYGYACWDDKDFLKHVWRAYPETRVKSRSVNPTVSVLADVTPRNVKFSKTYQTEVACAA